MQEVLVRLQKYDQRQGLDFLLGMGWDQNIWANTNMPTNSEINKLYPKKPVLLIRVDGHAGLVNQATLTLCGIDANSQIEGGEFVKNEQGELTGLLLDNALELVKEKFPDFQQQAIAEKLLEIQQELLSFGVTDVHEAGLSRRDFNLLDKMFSQGKMKIGVYGMLYPSEENIAFAKKNKTYQNHNFLVRSFKILGDGALGSRGAFLKKPYADYPLTRGLLVTNYSEMQRIAKVAKLIDYQLNIHAIGDSTNRLVLELIREIASENPDHRWRIEHAQVLDQHDYSLLKQSGAFPSVQPTHATSDCGWAEKRLGKERMSAAYAYKSLLLNSQMEMLAFGTDFPIEQLNPFLTIHAAINRKNGLDEPMQGFQLEEAVDEVTCMKAMTIWPAFASFQEETKGSLEKGKDATFVVLQNAFQPKGNFQANYAFLTVVKGEKLVDFNQ
jgi:hypothetical protein